MVVRRIARVSRVSEDIHDHVHERTSSSAEQIAQPPDDHVERRRVLAALGDDEVRVAPAGRHVELVHRPHALAILLLDRPDVAAAVLDVAANAAQEADVVVGIDEEAQVERVAKVGNREEENALDDDDRSAERRARPSRSRVCDAKSYWGQTAGRPSLSSTRSDSSRALSSASGSSKLTSARASAVR